MDNLYTRLGISSEASALEIKKAYKSLALKYHPDRNKDPRAEEIFKRINAAYRILGDPYKKAKYDLILAYQATPKPRVTYYQPETFRRPRYAPRKRDYVFDRNYYKYQAIAILIVLFIGALVMSVTRFNNYLKEQEIAEIKAENSRLIASAHTKFNMGDFQGALEMVQGLASKYPADYILNNERDEMVDELFKKAQQQYNSKDYENAIFNLLIVREFQKPMQLDTYRHLAKAFIATKNYEEAVKTYEYIYLRDKYNVELVLTIANLYHYEIKDINKSLKYYSKGKALFKSRQTGLYGKAFELVMNPDQVPDIYYNIFYHRAKANMDAGNYKIAITDCNWANLLRKEKPEPLMLRARCYMQQSNLVKACKDYYRALAFGQKAEPEFDFCENLLNNEKALF